MSRRDGDVNPLGDVIRKMLGEYHIDKKFEQSDLISSWPEIVGNLIASKTTKLFIKDKTLFVELSSSALKQELIMSKSVIMEKIEEHMGQKVVNSIAFL